MAKGYHIEKKAAGGSGSAAVEKILHFIEKNRKILLIFLGCIVLGTAALVAVYAINESMTKKAVAELDDYAERLAGFDMESTEAAELIAELEQFAESKSGYAGGGKKFPPVSASLTASCR